MFNVEPSAGDPMVGQVAAVRGTVVDALFNARMPPLGAMLRCQLDSKADILAVVHAHLGRDLLRAIAIDSALSLPTKCIKLRLAN